MKNELMHYGVLGMKWGVRKKYGTGGKVYRISGKESLKDGTKLYVTALGTRNAKSGANVSSDWGIAKTKKESVKIAERELVKDLNKWNDDRYESKSTEKLRAKVQKQAKNDYTKAIRTFEILDNAYQKSIIQSGRDSVSTMKLQTLSVLAKQDVIDRGKDYVDLLTKEQRKQLREQTKKDLKEIEEMERMEELDDI